LSREDVLVDDHLLLRVLLDEEPPELRPAGAQIFTTGLWYHRLSRALVNRRVTGALSRLLGPVDPLTAAGAVRASITLPQTIGLLSLRNLAWPMARLLDQGVRLNLMSLEALAAAEQLDALLCLAIEDGNRPLLAAAEARGVPALLM
jgi:hypothetical protein